MKYIVLWWFYKYIFKIVLLTHCYSDVKDLREYVVLYKPYTVGVHSKYVDVGMWYKCIYRPVWKRRYLCIYLTGGILQFSKIMVYATGVCISFSNQVWNWLSFFLQCADAMFAKDALFGYVFVCCPKYILTVRKLL